MSEPTPFHCLVCDGDQGRHQLRKEKLELRSCRSCGFVQQHPVPTEEEVHDMYADDGHYSDQLLKGEEAFLERERGVVAKLASSGAEGPLLDVGAGAGILLQAGLDQGWEGIGLELSGPSATHIRETLNIPVHETSIEEAPLEANSVGVVTFSHSLEHVRDPVGSLKRAAKLLRQGGRVHVAVPNWAAAKRVLVGGRVPWIYSHHISYFAKPTLGRALKEAGFEVESWEVNSFVGLDYPFVLSLWRRLGFDPIIRRFLHMGDRPLEELIADGVQIDCPPWRFRAVVGFAHLILRLWPERFFCALGRGEELRVTAIRK